MDADKIRHSKRDIDGDVGCSGIARSYKKLAAVRALGYLPCKCMLSSSAPQ
jgi:hypothetical protein